MSEEKINHPKHYGGADSPHEAIKVIEAWHVGFHTGNALKYIARAGKKSDSPLLEDLEKALWYLKRTTAHGAVTPLARRTMPIILGPTEVAAAWGVSRGLAGVLSAIYLGDTRKAVDLLVAEVANLKAVTP